MKEKNFPTPVKNRIIADNQQIVRIDHEEVIPTPASLTVVIEEGVQCIALSDYGKGTLTASFIEDLVAEAKKRNIPVIADPKGIDFHKYRGVTVLKPNLKEAYAAANLPLSASLDDVAARILEKTQAEILMITRSERSEEHTSELQSQR